MAGAMTGRFAQMPPPFSAKKIQGKAAYELARKNKPVELKAVEQFAPIHTAQVISYLRSTNFELGLLLNFNVCRMKEGIRRIVLTARHT